MFKRLISGNIPQNHSMDFFLVKASCSAYSGNVIHLCDRFS